MNSRNAAVKSLFFSIIGDSLPIYTQVGSIKLTTGNPASVILNKLRGWSGRFIRVIEKRYDIEISVGWVERDFIEA